MWEYFQTFGAGVAIGNALYLTYKMIRPLLEWDR